MRAAVPMLVSSLVFGSLIFDDQGMANRNLTFSPSNSEYMLSLNSKHKHNQPETPIPHRGTGRKTMIENIQNA
ncbi:heterocyst-inhibiting protein PatX [Anabaena azotica]|uniref:Secreted protein n=1 Tax=Anabaena azotica FACHB-119 TaxID=947527 RepID=A0ABR8CWW2_9NOST|nr:hypothetical protein [Anabaena azotica]MBD2499212.1 hypothetical protein [Anabaena azotica FACHB-119]